MQHVSQINPFFIKIPTTTSRIRIQHTKSEHIVESVPLPIRSRPSEQLDSLHSSYSTYANTNKYPERLHRNMHSIEPSCLPPARNDEINAAHIDLRGVSDDVALLTRIQKYD